MVAFVVCLVSLALVPLTYRLGYRRCLRRMNRQAWEVAEGFKRLQVERKARDAQREIIELGARKLEEKWERWQAQRSASRAAWPRSGTQYDARGARAARDAARAGGRQ